MSIPARVPGGVPSGGQFSTVAKSEPNLSLVVTDGSSRPAGMGSAPPFPDKVAMAAQWPNRYQRMDRLNEAYYAIASHPSSPGPECLAAARSAVRDTFDASGRFVALPEDDGEAASFVFEAITNDRKVGEALDRVGVLADHETRSFGNRLAGALHDIEAAERDDRVTEAAIAEHAVALAPPAPVTRSGAADEWPSWLPTEPPVQDETW